MQKVKQLLKTPKIADLRNIYEPKDMRDLGFEYVGVGR
jgi:UDPglucose 6-dehydrogenase